MADVRIDATGKQLAVSPHHGGWNVQVHQGFGEEPDVLRIQVDDDVVQLPIEEAQLANLARVIDSYLQAVTGHDLWGNGPQRPSDEAEARAYAAEQHAASENGPALPHCADCGAVGVWTGHMGCQYPGARS